MKNYLKILTEDIHSVTIATIDSDGHPQTRIIDIMLWDNNGIYFLTAKGKLFYKQLIKQKYISISAVKDKISISLRGKVKNIGFEKLNEIFDKNTYMKSIYPENTRYALEVFCLYEAEGEYFNISIPSEIVRENFVIGKKEISQNGYYIENNCIKCGQCIDVCPQKCIDIKENIAVINQKHCLHCGNCFEKCTVNAVIRKE